MDRNVFPAIGTIGLLLLTACGGGGSGAGNSGSGVSGVQTLRIMSAAPPSGNVATPYDARVGPTCASGSPNCVCISGGGSGAGLSRPRCNIAEHGYQLAVSGGTTPYSFKWAAAAGSALPPSLTLSATGLVDGSPTAAGSYEVVVTVSDASIPAAQTNANYTIVVAPAPLAITTATLANGVIGTSYDQTIQATGGAAPYVWTVSSGALPNRLSLSTSTTSTVTVSGTPDTVAQGVALTIEVADSAHNTATQAYTVSILLQADSLVLSPASLDFGNRSVGSASGALPGMLTNTATSPMVITGIAIAGSNAAEFTQTATCGASLTAGASCAFNVIFTPGQIGPRSAALIITDDSAGSPQSVSLSGVGLTAGPNATLSGSTLTFGTQLVGTTSPAMSVALSNYGIATLNVVHIAATASFAETDNCVPSLASGTTCAISVTFTPGASGDTPGKLSISDDAPGSPQTVSLSGTGSTNTPPLTGYCWGSVVKRDGPPPWCGSAQDLVQCPVGQPAVSPSIVAGGCGPGPPQTQFVDAARACRAQTSAGLPISGNCLTGP
jgi:hypothetical protein